MSGLKLIGGCATIAKMYGEVIIDGEKYVWDYAQDFAVSEADMPHGSERHILSERARWLNEKPEMANDRD